ncbi:hypothetical protein KY290_025753 [Solanum tuberosum]|uniref:Uncharacterized protein n=1 Tax=Solanum tuberosum TaxID=4113 RepID=A0ABQ7UWG2_SOLTU|nr:hypothetical protein KY285_024589 [Solanum tuberosum]KAH0755483.1 hypothetical protein KY290_025753 [Solanum tuberosum]
MRFLRSEVVGGGVTIDSIYYYGKSAGRLVGGEKGPYSVPHSVLLSALPGNSKLLEQWVEAWNPYGCPCFDSKALAIPRYSVSGSIEFHSPLSHSSELVSRAFRQFLAAFTFNPIHRLRALYAQSFRRTLAPPVLPRLLARMRGKPAIREQKPSVCKKKSLIELGCLGIAPPDIEERSVGLVSFAGMGQTILGSVYSTKPRDAAVDRALEVLSLQSSGEKDLRASCLNHPQLRD